MAPWVTLAKEDEIPDGEGRAYEVGERTVGIYRCRDELFAIDDVCTHAYALLHEGSVDRFRCTVECPLHSTEFDLRTGAVLTPPATEPAAVFRVRVQDRQIQVELPD
jgi:3-phenylpropionate/trans-cinnamate dioxygenase ferredoxin subunit